MPFKLVCMKNIVEIKNMDSSQISYYLSTLSLTVLYYNTYNVLYRSLQTLSNWSYAFIYSPIYKNVANAKANQMC